MDEQTKIKLRPLYNELQGYLAQTPTPKGAGEVFYSQSQWEFVNKAIDRLNGATGKNYDHFRIVQVSSYSPGNDEDVYVSTVRAMLGGLISSLHGEYFSDEPSPFTGVPSTVINQNQTQQQSVSVLILEMQRNIDAKLDTTKDEKEKGFLKKLEVALPKITSGVQLAKTILDLTAQMGLDPHQISRLFS